MLAPRLHLRVGEDLRVEPDRLEDAQHLVVDDRRAGQGVRLVGSRSIASTSTPWSPSSSASSWPTGPRPQMRRRG